ncbi:hypothetical protein KKG83_03590 [Candidatus Micrarchaeota archaeon]|nr:hypothetical protein [Candidatus Micrarchaeota archaeon]MBU2476528.1 hypothetical protein [Candidatus Micrarchaeota archaeon]
MKGKGKVLSLEFIYFKRRILSMTLKHSQDYFKVERKINRMRQVCSGLGNNFLADFELMISKHKEEQDIAGKNFGLVRELIY